MRIGLATSAGQRAVARRPFTQEMIKANVSFEAAKSGTRRTAVGRELPFVAAAFHAPWVARSAMDN